MTQKGRQREYENKMSKERIRKEEWEKEDERKTVS